MIIFPVNHFWAKMQTNLRSGEHNFASIEHFSFVDRLLLYFRRSGHHPRYPTFHRRKTYSLSHGQGKSFRDLSNGSTDPHLMGDATLIQQVRLSCCYVLSCYVLTCYVLSCYVWYVLTCYVLLCYILTCYVLSCYVLTCYVLSCMS